MVDTYVIIGGGPSVTDEALDLVRAEHKAGNLGVMVINNSIFSYPDADWLHCGDYKWYRWFANEDAVRNFKGVKTCLESQALQYDETVRLFKQGKISGLELTRGNTITTGRSSGYQGINICTHLGAKRILLLGFDAKYDKNKSHHYKKGYPVPTYEQWLNNMTFWDTLISPLKQIGVEVINCCLDSKINAFNKQTIEEALNATAKTKD